MLQGFIVLLQILLSSLVGSDLLFFRRCTVMFFLVIIKLTHQTHCLCAKQLRRAGTSNTKSLKEPSLSEEEEDKESQGSSDVDIQSAEEEDDDEDFEA